MLEILRLVVLGDSMAEQRQSFNFFCTLKNKLPMSGQIDDIFYFCMFLVKAVEYKPNVVIIISSNESLMLLPYKHLYKTLAI